MIILITFLSESVVAKIYHCFIVCKLLVQLLCHRVIFHENLVLLQNVDASTASVCGSGRRGEL